MDGLSQAAESILESFSSIEILKEYYLIGGTGLSLQIKHRLSEDLDFCQWIPERHSKYAIPVNTIHTELQQRFGVVSKSHSDFHQVNFLVENPKVKITFYQTDLKKSNFDPISLIGNISIAPLKVLGGSKMFVVTKRDALRDYYDLYVLIKEDHLTVAQMIDEARIMSRDVTPKKLYRTFKMFSFDGNRFKLSDLDKLEAKYQVGADQYIAFCKFVTFEIAKLYPNVIKEPAPKVQRTAEHLKQKIQNADQFLAVVTANAMNKFGLTQSEINDMIMIGTSMSHMEGQEAADMDLEEKLIRHNGSVTNLIKNLKDRFNLNQKELAALTSDNLNN